MAEPARTLSIQRGIVARLHDFGMKEEHVHEAVRRGLSARLSCDKLHPPGFPGIYQWAETHRGLRDVTARDGWKPNDDANFSTIVSDDGATAITVATGNRFTGTNGPLQPTTKYPRGSQTQLAIEANRTLSLFDDPVEIEAAQPPPSWRVTWVLLIRTDRTAGEVRYELSRPEGRDADGRVNSWSERIVFPPLKIFAPLTIDDDDLKTDEIDVPVDRL